MSPIPPDQPPPDPGDLRAADGAVLAEREAWFRLVVESAPNGIIVVDPGGRIALANAQAERAFGYEPGELLGQPVEVLVPERLRGRHGSLRSGFMAGPEARPMGAGRDLFGRCKDGREFPVEIGLAPLRLRDQTMVLATVVDITGRKRAEDTVRFLAEASFVLAGSLDYETTLESVARLVVPRYADWCGVDLLDDEGRLQPVAVVHVDPSKAAWARELRQRYPTNMDAPTGAPNVIRTGRSEVYPDIPDTLLRTVAVDDEHYRILKDVGLRSAVIAPLSARGRTLGVLTLVRAGAGHPYGEADLHAFEELARMCALAVDNARLYREAQREVEERRRAEREVKQLNETLEQRVAARTADLERANRELQIRNRELQEFAYVANHDLQEPLRKIHSFADLLVAEHAGALDAEARSFLDRIQRAARRLSTLLSDLLAFSRVQTQGGPFRKIDLGRIVHEVLADLDEAVRQLGAEVEVGELPRVEADAAQMRQLFRHLIANALRYARAGTAPRVTIRGHVADEPGAPGRRPTAVVEVADDGMGFDEKYLDRIFRPFQRLQGRSDHSGTGMGLAICQRIAERHGGTLTARSIPGQGSTFVVTLPVRPGETAGGTHR